MKTIIAVLFLAVPAVACRTDQIAQAGVCVDMPQPKDTMAVAETKPSDEKPPRDKMPSWQREGIVAALPESQIANDIVKDNDLKCTAISGKTKGHVPLTDDEKAFRESTCKKGK